MNTLRNTISLSPILRLPFISLTRCTFKFKQAFKKDEKTLGETNTICDDNVTKPNDNDNDLYIPNPNKTDVNIPTQIYHEPNALAKIMNALATRNGSIKPLLKNAYLHEIDITDSRNGLKSDNHSDILPFKFIGCEDLIECTYGEFENDLKAGIDTSPSSDSFVQFHESKFLSTEV